MAGSKGARPRELSDYDLFEGANLMRLAAGDGRAAEVAQWLAAGVDPKVRHQWGETPLIAAAWAGHLECVLLLRDVSDPNAVGLGGMNALMCAIWDRHPECAKALVGCSDLAAKDLSGKNALMLSIVKGDRELVDLLLERCDWDAMFAKGSVSKGRSVVDLALDVERPELASYLEARWRSRQEAMALEGSASPARLRLARRI